MPAKPRLELAVLACMDARMNVYRLLGLREGDAHVIRNAGGAVTDDAIRSLTVSQHLLGTREIVLLHHRDCGMRTFTDTEFARRLEERTGIRPGWAAETFTDPAQDVRQCIARLRASPFLPHTRAVRGYVLDERTGALDEVK
ncbi:carbonic anhydrase [Amycolatopsis sp., V23-08]|uniref:carbonic anhydrase n=1 Tax=Amycolatopsis heterodermiae TaxID=3110235 RepID=A0ABU5R5W9_9PSEU|nr:carbonic anhydrase [Amycolatopsis sp., V23-08]MEA5361044.1 carbonic anhydrase [Amycolatopsis sp., V23-08]